MMGEIVKGAQGFRTYLRVLEVREEYIDYLVEEFELVGVEP